MNQQLATIEKLLQALGDRTRLRILGLLVTGEVCVCHIHESLRVSQPKVSRHLAYLRRAGLVETRREGLWVYYRLAKSADPLILTIRDVVAHTLAHVPGIRRDAERLQKKNGCCVPEAAASSIFQCCASSPRSGQTLIASRNHS